MAGAVMRLAGIDAARVLFQENPRRVLNGQPLLQVPAGRGGEARKKRLFGFFG